MLVVDDEDLIRTAFISVINAEDDMEVVGEAVDGAAAVRLAASSRSTLSSWMCACRSWTD